MLTKLPPAENLRTRMAVKARSARAALADDLHAMPPWLRWAMASWLMLVVIVVVFLVVFDWNWARGPVSRIASAQLHRDVRIDGDLKVHPWSFSPRAEIGGLKIGQPDWAGPGDMATAEQVAVRIKVLPLLRGQVILPELRIDKPNVAMLREASGRANWTFGDPAKPGKPFKLPAIQHFVINDGDLKIDDKVRRLVFTGKVTSNEQATGDGRGRFELKGDGTLNGAKFLALITGGPLLNISPDRPYPITADVRAGTTHIVADGRIDKPFDLGHLGGAVDLSGSDLNNLYYLTGLSLPNTPPYRIKGTLRRDLKTFDFTKFSGTVGDSDVSGDLKAQFQGERPLLTGAISSKRLDFDDLGSIVGAAPATGRGETASAGQKVEAGQRAARGRLLPDATLQVDRIRAMDAQVTYRAQTVNAPNLPLRTVALDIDLKGGVLTIDPLSFTFSRGDLSGKIRLDARGAVPKTDADLRLANGRLEDFVTLRNGAKPAIEGVIAARAKLSGTGNSIHKAAASSDGTITVVIPRGQIRQAFAELLGINASKGLILLLSGDNKETPLRCAVADFKVAGGVLTAQKVVFDTGVVLATGSGTINLETERIDLRIEGETKKARLVRLWAPITLKGSLSAPKVGVEAGKVAAQGGIGLLLGSLLSPLATILPFVDPGLAKNADCVSLMNEARSSPAPVRTAATTPTAKK